LDCVAYNVMENNVVYPSFSMDGMVPYQVTREGCPFQMQSSACYVVYMERRDMQVLKAYLAVDGGLDIHYSVSTDDSANVLGSPLVTSTPHMLYTLTGNCFTALNTQPSPLLRKMPPMTALGNTCGLLPFRASAAPCSQPLNNPFITDVATSSYLLPQGLASRLQHQTLLKIFNASQLPLYRQILDNTHNGTVPIDFVELGGTRDVVYITQTTIGLISTKGLVFMDIFNPGYCRATKAVLCPWGSFGSVGSGACRPCAEADTSVSAQIQCTGVSPSTQQRRLLVSSFQSPPYTQLSLLVTSKQVTQSVLNMLTSYYQRVRGLNCSAESGMTEYQPYNMQADYAEADLPLPNQQLIPSLLEHASAGSAQNFSAQVSEEYLVQWTTSQTTLVDALGTTHVSAEDMAPGECGVPGWAISVLKDSAECRSVINRDFHRNWLPCALRAVLPYVNASGTGQQRRLLAQQQPIAVGISEHSQCTFMSSTTVSYGISSAGAPAGSKPSAPAPYQSSSSQEGASWVLVAGASAGIVIAVLVVVVVYCFLFRHGEEGGGEKELKSA
jgi:hypothetical protein